MNKLIFDIGSTNLKFALMTPQGEILEREKIRTNYESIDNYFQPLIELVNKHSASANAIAISSNGRMKMDKNTYRAYISQTLRDVNIKTEVEKRCELPVTVLNDGSAAALGEWWQGSGKGCENLLTIVLGSGVGAGLILNGKLYEGSRLNASAFFNMFYSREDGRYKFAALPTSFVAMRYKLGAAKKIPFNEMNGKMYFDFVSENDPVALALLNEYCSIIAELIYNADMLLDLDKIVITGGLAEKQLITQIVNKKLSIIAADFHKENSSPMMAGTIYDFDDSKVEVTKGKLLGDSNLFGALYYLLQCEKNK